MWKLFSPVYWVVTIVVFLLSWMVWSFGTGLVLAVLYAVLCFIVERIKKNQPVKD